MESYKSSRPQASRYGRGVGVGCVPGRGLADDPPDAVTQLAAFHVHDRMASMLPYTRPVGFHDAIDAMKLAGRAAVLVFTRNLISHDLCLGPFYIK